jgi:hypothetical protein
MKPNKYRTIRVLLGVTFLFASTITGFAQNGYKLLKGSVVDEQSGTPLSYVSVFVSGSSVGTVTNASGEFVIKVSDTLSAPIIEFSHMGYLSRKVDPLKAESNGLLVRLSPNPVTLNEVLVYEKDPYEVFKKMLRNAEQNYGTTSCQMRGFFRESIRKRSNYIYISEAIVDVYKASYTRQFDTDHARVFKGRKSNTARTADTVLVKLQGGANVLLLMDIVKNPYIIFDQENLHRHVMRLGDIEVIDNRPLLTLIFTPEERPAYPMYTGKLYIDAQTYALVAADFMLDLKDAEQVARVLVRKKPLNMKFVPLNTHYYVKYKQTNGLWTLSYARYDLEYSCNFRRGWFRSRYATMAEFVVTDVDNSHEAQKFPVKERLKPTAIFEDNYQAFVDPDFWGTDNYIQPEKPIEEALAKYAKWLKRNGNKE